MPRYLYKCTQCAYSGSFFHAMEESIEVCEQCNEKSMQKVFNNSFRVTSKRSSKAPQVGELTKEYIEENRKVLKDQQDAAKGQTYE